MSFTIIPCVHKAVIKTEILIRTNRVMLKPRKILGTTPELFYTIVLFRSVCAQPNAKSQTYVSTGTVGYTSLSTHTHSHTRVPLSLSHPVTFTWSIFKIKQKLRLMNNKDCLCPYCSLYNYIISGILQGVYMHVCFYLHTRRHCQTFTILTFVLLLFY